MSTVSEPAATAADAPPPLADRLGLPGTIALVLGGIVGTGIFAIPAAVAPFGWLSIPAFLVVGLGSFALALCFADLARRTRASGGPYRHAQEAFGDFAGFLGAWTYWIQGWAGHATIAAAAAGYVQALTGADEGRGTTLVLALAVLAVPLVLNLTGTRPVGAVAVVTTVLKIGALLFIAVVGLTAFDAGNIGGVQAPEGRDHALAALPAACAVLLFAFLGMEGATVVTDRVRDARRDIPRAVIGGVAVVAVLYFVATLAVQGALPQDELVGSSAPFADATGAVLGGTWPARFVAAVAVISALGALTGFNMVNAEMVAGAARDRLFPAALGRRRRPGAAGGGVPVRALLLNAALAATLLVVNATGDALSVFTTLALLSTFVYVFGYVLAVSAQLLHALRARERGEAPTPVQVVVALVAVAFSIWMASATGPDAVRSGTVLILVGIPVFVVSRARRGGPPADPAGAGPAAG
jgi:APA family basic amino acid/polyamine antiporter